MVSKNFKHQQIAMRLTILTSSSWDQKICFSVLGASSLLSTLTYALLPFVVGGVDNSSSDGISSSKVCGGLNGANWECSPTKLKFWDKVGWIRFVKPPGGVAFWPLQTGSAINAAQPFTFKLRIHQEKKAINVIEVYLEHLSEPKKYTNQQIKRQGIYSVNVYYPQIQNRCDLPKVLDRAPS